MDTEFENGRELSQFALLNDFKITNTFF